MTTPEAVVIILASFAVFFGLSVLYAWKRERADRQSELLAGIAFRLAELDDKIEDVLYLLQQDDDGVVVEVYEREATMETMSA